MHQQYLGDSLDVQIQRRMESLGEHTLMTQVHEEVKNLSEHVYVSQVMCNHDHTGNVEVTIVGTDTEGRAFCKLKFFRK